MISWLVKLFKKPDTTDWFYIGYRDIYLESFNSARTYTITLKFFFDVNNTKNRKAEIAGTFPSCFRVKKDHQFWTKYVDPWLKGDGTVAHLVTYPSENFKEFVRVRNNLEWDYEKFIWVKCKPNTTTKENIISVDFTKGK